MLLATSQMSRIKAWILGTAVIVGSAALVRVLYVESPPPAPPRWVPPSVSNVPVDPLAVPDFAGGPEFKLNVDFDTLVQPVRKAAETARPEIQARRAEAVNQFPLGGLLVPVHLKATTQRQADDEYFQYRLQELEAYRQLTQDEPVAKAAGERFLRAYLEHATQQMGAPSEDTVGQLGEAALVAGSRDPLIRTYDAHFQVRTGKDAEAAERTITETLPLLSQSNYPRVVVAFVRIRLSELSRKKHNSFGHAMSNSPPAELDRWPAAVVAIVRWLEEEADRPQWRRSTYRRFLNAWDMANDNDKLLLLSGCLQAKKIDPWLLHTVLGDYYVKRGWQFRGTSYADKVDERQWKPFHEHLAFGSTHLQYAWHLHPELPEPAARMIPVAMANGGGEQNPHEWFLRTIEAQFDYHEAYAAMWSSLQPRWGGSVRKMIELGQRCVETDRFDTAVPLMLLNILEVIRDEELEPGQTLVKDAGAQPLLRQFVTRREAYRKGRADRPLYVDNPARRTHLALLMLECELFAEALTELRELGDKADLVKMKSNGRTGDFELAMLFAGQGETRPKVLALAETLRRKWDPRATPDAVAEVEATLRSLEPTAPEPRVATFYRHARRMWEQLRDYSTGQWVNLTFDPELSGWEIFADDWSLDEEPGAIRLASRKGRTPRLHLRALAAFRPPFVVEMDIELPAEPPPYLHRSGIHFAKDTLTTYEDWDARQPFFGVSAETGIDIQTKQPLRRDFAIYPSPYRGEPTRRFLLASAGKHRLRVKLWDRAFEHRIDDAARDGVLFDGLHPEGGLCFGETFFVSSNQDSIGHSGKLRLSNLRICRLDTPSPPTDSATPEEREAYWQARLIEDADDPFAHLHLAWTMLNLQRFDEAARHARRALESCPKIEGAHGILGRIAYHSGRLHEAVGELTLAGAEMREDVVEMAIWAEILSTAPDDKLRNGRQAKNIAELAQKISGKPRAQVLSALAAAHAELGEFEKAVEWNARAIEIADEMEKTRLQQRHELYKANQPYRSEQP